MSRAADMSIAGPRERRKAMSLPDALLEDVPLFALIAAYACAAELAGRLIGAPGSIHWTASWRLIGAFALLYIGGASIFALVHIVVVRRRSLQRVETWRAWAETLFAKQKVLGFGIVFVALSLMMPVFVAFKSSIPLFHPFSWDVTFMEWDRWLHFGRHPYELLLPWLDHPAVTKAIDITYFSWIHVMWLTVVWQAWHGSRETVTRSQFLLAFALCWILLGTALATVLSSAGPIYFGQVAGSPDPYAPMLEHLTTTNEVYTLRVLRIRDLLWTAYQNPGGSLVAGISAMPSLHIAIAVLMAFLGFSINRWLGWAYTLFAIVIFIGSIHLAWHYAIDGYVSAVAVAILWWASGRVANSWKKIRKPTAAPGPSGAAHVAPRRDRGRHD